MTCILRDSSLWLPNPFSFCSPRLCLGIMFSGSILSCQGDGECSGLLRLSPGASAQTWLLPVLLFSSQEIWPNSIYFSELLSYTRSLVSFSPVTVSVPRLFCVSNSYLRALQWGWGPGTGEQGKGLTQRQRLRRLKITVIEPS